MNDNHFYLTLPSNGSKQYYGKQRGCDYKTKLEHSIALDPEGWEVGLAEFTYPKSWHNVPACKMYVTYPSPEGGDRDYSLHTTATFGGTRFLNGKHLIRDLQQKVRELLPDVHREAIAITYDEISNRATFTFKRFFGLWLQTPLAQVLGITKKIARRSKVPIDPHVSGGGLGGYVLPKIHSVDRANEAFAATSTYTINVDRLIPTIYVYCDLVQPQFVGDAYVRLLRTISVQRDVGDVITHKFTNVHYANMQTGNFESIAITLADNMGEYIDFKHGDVIVKLHFRRKKR